MGQFGPKNGAIDTLVLGCTHYPFVSETLRALVGNDVAFLEGGAPVARQTRRLLTEGNWLAPAPADATPIAPPVFCTTGDANNLKTAVQRWLDVNTAVHSLVINP